MATTFIDLNSAARAGGGAGAWEFKGINAYGTMPRGKRRAAQWMTADVPGTVHTDLMAAGVIPDPLVGTNEALVQWVDSQRWVYRRRFDVAGELFDHDRIDLVAQGLDTFAEIRINRKLVAATANMFIPHRIDVRRHLRRGRNTIEILFDSPTQRTKALEELHGALRVALESPRVYARKAQYSFSWDWGPKLATSGIWKGISIEASSGPQLAHPFARVLSLDARSAVVEISVEIAHPSRGAMKLDVTVDHEGWSATAAARVAAGRATVRMKVPDPSLWWPNGYGAQPLYRARLVLSDGDALVDAAEMRFAIRTVELLQEKDEEGISFVVKLNGVPVFCKGADWIPCDSFLPRIADATYERLLAYAKDAHMNMIRVWGGGIYEQDVFYDLCDELGLMVWQDFMFACGEYPENKWFLDQVREEASSVVRRLRNHPSIVVWCGNNESEWLFCTEQPGRSPDDMTGARIFSDILPAACGREDGTRPYWRSSPFGAGFPNDESNGNHHQWTVWSAWQDYAVYEKVNARFVTEFGFQAPANRQTFEEALPERDCRPQSEAFEYHNKQVDGPERLIRFQAAHHNVSTDFDGFIFKSQLVQAEALKCAVEHWRRRKFRTAGALFWQLNDCWPVSSWSVVDSALRPKAAYYFAKKFYAPVLVSFKRLPGAVEVHLTNDRLTPVKGVLKLSLRSFEGPRRWSETLPSGAPANSTKRIRVIGAERYGRSEKGAHYLLAQFLVHGAVVSENRFFFEEPKRLRLPAARVSMRVTAIDAGAYGLAIGADRFVKYLRLELDGADGGLGDNYFDLDAGERRMIILRSALSIEKIRSRLRVRWLE